MGKYSLFYSVSDFNGEYGVNVDEFYIFNGSGKQAITINIPPQFFGQFPAGEEHRLKQISLTMCKLTNSLYPYYNTKGSTPILQAQPNTITSNGNLNVTLTINGISDTKLVTQKREFTAIPYDTLLYTLSNIVEHIIDIDGKKYVENGYYDDIFIDESDGSAPSGYYGPVRGRPGFYDLPYNNNGNVLTDIISGIKVDNSCIITFDINTNDGKGLLIDNSLKSFTIELEYTGNDIWAFSFGYKPIYAWFVPDGCLSDFFKAKNPEKGYDNPQGGIGYNHVSDGMQCNFITEVNQEPQKPIPSGDFVIMAADTDDSPNCVIAKKSVSIPDSYSLSGGDCGISDKRTVTSNPSGYVNASGSVGSPEIKVVAISRTASGDTVMVNVEDVHKGGTYHEAEYDTDEEGNEHLVSPAYCEGGTYDNSVSKDYSISFFLRETRQMDSSYNTIWNAYQAATVGQIQIGPSFFIQNSKLIQEGFICFKRGTTNQVQGVTVNNQNSGGSSFIKISDFFKLANDGSNSYKISEDASAVPYTLRFYNSLVQQAICDANSDNNGSYTIGKYMKQRTLNLTITCAPTINSLSKQSYRDRDNNIISESCIPDIILMNQEDIMVSDIGYNNQLNTGGYCRAFECILRDANTKQIDTRWVLDVDPNGSDAFYSGKILQKGSVTYRSITSNRLLELVIRPSFYFDNDHNTLYSSSEIVFNKKFIKIEDENLLPKLLFPILNRTAPYTSMMLPDVERFGYYFEDIIAEYWGKLSCKFGLRINNKYDVYLTENQYWSNYEVVAHMIFDIGLFVLNHDDCNLANLHIQPFIETNTLCSKQTKRYYANDSYIDTTLESMWYRPLAIKGEYLKYEQYQQFMQFINKYVGLVNSNYNRLKQNQDYYSDLYLKDGDRYYWYVPKIVYGMIINTEFWVQKANQITANYVLEMQDWANLSFKSNSTGHTIKSRVTNPAVIWIKSEFEHYKGEYLLAGEPYTTNPVAEYSIRKLVSPAPINNVRQIYRELLQGASAYGKLATHDYLKNKGYTHIFLHNYTYEQITMRQDGV